MKPNAPEYYNPDPAYLRSLLERAGIGTRKAAELIGINNRELRHYLSGTRKHPYGVQFCLECLAEDFPQNERNTQSEVDDER
jgi:hypothetical protein